MKRFFIKNLEKWFSKANRKPLVLSGARQVGKIWVLEEFWRTHYKKVAYVNFDKNDPLKCEKTMGSETFHFMPLEERRFGSKEVGMNMEICQNR